MPVIELFTEISIISPFGGNDGLNKACNNYAHKYLPPKHFFVTIPHLAASYLFPYITHRN